MNLKTRLEVPVHKMTLAIVLTAGVALAGCMR